MSPRHTSSINNSNVFFINLYNFEHLQQWNPATLVNVTTPTFRISKSSHGNFIYFLWLFQLLRCKSSILLISPKIPRYPKCQNSKKAVVGSITRFCECSISEWLSFHFRVCHFLNLLLSSQYFRWFLMKDRENFNPVLFHLSLHYMFVSFVCRCCLYFNTFSIHQSLNGHSVHICNSFKNTWLIP